MIPSIKTPCLTLCLLSLPLLVAQGQGALWLFAGSPVLFCLSHSGFVSSHGTAGTLFFGGKGLEGDMIISWLLSFTVRWGLADFQLCLLFPGHIPISCLRSALALCWASWLRLEDELLCRHLFDRSSQFAIVHMLKKPYGRALWPSFNYLVVSFCCEKNQDGISTNFLDPKNQIHLNLPLNLEPKVTDVTSKHSKQPQGEVEAKMKRNDDGLCLHVSGVLGNEFWWMWSMITQVPLLQFLLHSRTFIRCAWIMAYGFQIKQGKPRHEPGLFLDGG